MSKEEKTTDPNSSEDPRAGIYSEKRPWGGFRRYTHNQVSTVKIITVNPGEVLSLQYHNQRNELWVPLLPGLQVTLGSRIWEPRPFEEIFIPRGTTHRAAGVGTLPSKWMEISFGEFEEDDIVRLEDSYGRS
jgi:mannose-6-phosphate isomerase